MCQFILCYLSWIKGSSMSASATTYTITFNRHCVTPCRGSGSTSLLAVQKVERYYVLVTCLYNKQIPFVRYRQSPSVQDEDIQARTDVHLPSFLTSAQLQALVDSSPLGTHRIQSFGEEISFPEANWTSSDPTLYSKLLQTTKRTVRIILWDGARVGSGIRDSLTLYRIYLEKQQSCIPIPSPSNIAKQNTRAQKGCRFMTACQQNSTQLTSWDLQDKGPRRLEDWLSTTSPSLKSL
jgi:hypothetical protein